jgi:hypothetical protein
MRRALCALAFVLAPAALGGCNDDGSETRRSVAELVGPQLAYLEPDSSLVVSVDLRYDGDNWETLKPVVERSLRAQRERDGSEDVPEDLDAWLEQVSRSAGLDFEDDLRPALDGHVVVGVTFPPRYPPPRNLDGVERLELAARRREERTVLVYRTREGDLRELVRRFGRQRLEPVPGHPDVAAIGDSIAVAGRDTLVVVDGGEDPLAAALDRAEAGAGFPAARLETARRDVDFADPFVLASGDLTLARELVEEPDLRRALREVPYLGAVERISAGLQVGGDDAAGRVKIATTGARLSPEELPVGPAGELALPKATGAAVGASRDQSRTTTFAAQVVRALYADSGFVAAVERAERDLGASFEDEVLRQFDCPSVSVFDNEDPAGPSFGARSCVRDPDRMRELLPELAPHLPSILTAMRGLGEEGLLGLLLVAPDAPLTPSALVDLAQIVVEPFGGAESRPEEDLYEVSDPTTQAIVPGVSSVVFGMIGDEFVVASDRETARSVARIETEELDREAASAIRLPLEMVPFAGSLPAFFSDLELTVAADPDATTVEARIGYAP